VHNRRKFVKAISAVLAMNIKYETAARKRIISCYSPEYFLKIETESLRSKQDKRTLYKHNKL